MANGNSHFDFGEHFRSLIQDCEGECDVAVQAVEQGYLVIAPATRAFGETRSPADTDKNAVSSCRLQLMHDLLGRTPIGLQGTGPELHRGGIRRD